MEIGIIWALVLCVVSAVGAIFIYRNNVDTFSPFADRIDEMEDRLASKIEKIRKDNAKKS